MDEPTRRDGVRLILAACSATRAPRAVARRALYFFSDLYGRAAATEALGAEVGALASHAAPSARPLNGTRPRAAQEAHGSAHVWVADRLASPRLALAAAAACVQLASKIHFSDGERGDTDVGGGRAFTALKASELLRVARRAAREGGVGRLLDYPLTPTDVKTAELATLTAITDTHGSWLPDCELLGNRSEALVMQLAADEEACERSDCDVHEVADTVENICVALYEEIGSFATLAALHSDTHAAAVVAAAHAVERLREAPATRRFSITRWLAERVKTCGEEDSGAPADVAAGAREISALAKVILDIALSPSSSASPKAERMTVGRGTAAVDFQAAREGQEGGSVDAVPSATPSDRASDARGDSHGCAATSCATSQGKSKEDSDDERDMAVSGLAAAATPTATSISWSHY